MLWNINVTNTLYYTNCMLVVLRKMILSHSFNNKNLLTKKRIMFTVISAVAFLAAIFMEFTDMSFGPRYTFMISY